MNRVLTITILLFFCLLFTVYFLFPKYLEFKPLKEEISKKESLLRERETYFLNLENISKTLENYEKPLKKINSALPDTPSIASLLSFLQKKSSENGLVLRALGQTESLEVQTEQEKETPEIKKSYFSISLIGNLFSFENFLKTLEKSSRIIEVENIFLKETTEEFLEITLSIKVHSY